MERKKKVETGLGSITELKGNRAKRFWARSPAYRDSNGKLRRNSLGTYKTFGEAHEALKSGIPNNVKKLTLYNCYEKFVKSKKYERLTEQTRSEYDRNILKFEPLIYRSIKDITFLELQAKMDELIEDGFYVTKGGELVHKAYKPSTLRKINAAVTASYDVAIDEGIITQNFGERIKRITDEKADKFPPIDLDFVYETFDRLNAGEFDNNTKFKYNVMRVLVNVYTGLRPSEMVSFKKQNIDWEHGYIFNIGVKTEAGRKRKVPISEKIKPLLKELCAIKSSDYILGKKYTVNKFRDNFFYPTIKDLGYTKEVVAYSCRHTFADILSISKVDKEVIKQVMGHTSYSTTSDFYISENINSSIEEFKNKIK